MCVVLLPMSFTADALSSEPIARANGCTSVRTYTGHGIDYLFHSSAPNVPHYAKNKAMGTMKAGMVKTPYLTCFVQQLMFIFFISGIYHRTGRLSP